MRRTRFGGLRQQSLWRYVGSTSLSLLALSLVISGCGPGVQHRLDIVSLIDFSGSLSEETVDRYIVIITSHILGNLDEKDRLVVLPIDEGAKREPVRIVFEDMSRNKFSHTTDGLAHACERRAERLREYASQAGPRIQAEVKKQKVLRKKYTNLTDIISAIEQTATLFREDEKRETLLDRSLRFLAGKRDVVSAHMLVLFSDMIQESEDYNFARSGGPSKTETSRIVSQLAERGRTPNLTGVKVFVNGRTGTSNRQIENIEHFWREYFRITKADLVAYGFDSGNEIASQLSDRRKGC